MIYYNMNSVNIKMKRVKNLKNLLYCISNLKFKVSIKIYIIFFVFGLQIF